MVGNYIKRVLTMVQYRNKTFDNTLEEGFTFMGKGRKSTRPKTQGEPEGVQDEYEDEILSDDVEKWGAGIGGAIDYDILNTHYKFLKSANPNCDSNQEIFINDLCYIKMQQMKALRDGNIDGYNKLIESYRKSFQQAGLKTVKDVSINDEFTLGVTAEVIEKYTPAEWYKNKKLYKDFDGIGEYIERFLLRPLRNLQHGTTDRDAEFCVDDDGDADGYPEDE